VRRPGPGAGDSRGMVRGLAVALVAALALLAAGCGGKESSATAKQNFCSSVDELAASVVALQGLSPSTTTKDDLKAARQRIEDAWDQVRDDSEDLKDATVSDLRQAGDELSSGVKSLPDDATLVDAAVALRSDLTSFAQAFSKTVSSVGCKDSASN
jgi:hypothetical protein